MFAVDVVEGLALFGQRVASKKHKDYHVFFKEKIQVSWIFTCSLLEVGENLQVTTSLNCPLIFSIEFFGFPLRSQKKNLVGTTTAGENRGFRLLRCGRPPFDVLFATPNFRRAWFRFHKQGGYGEPKKNIRRDFLFGAGAFFGGLLFVFLLILRIFLNPRPSWEKYMDDPDGNLCEHVWSN